MTYHLFNAGAGSDGPRRSRNVIVAVVVHADEMVENGAKATRPQTGGAYRRVLLRCPRVSVLWSASANKPVEELSNS
jgi:hypothetical protein